MHGMKIPVFGMLGAEGSNVMVLVGWKLRKSPTRSSNPEVAEASIWELFFHSFLKKWRSQGSETLLVIGIMDILD